MSANHCSSSLRSIALATPSQYSRGPILPASYSMRFRQKAFRNSETVTPQRSAALAICASVGGKQRTPPKSKMTPRILPAPMRAVGNLRFAARTDLADCVDPAALAFEISPRQHFTQQPGAKQNHARDQRQRAQHHQWPVLLNYVHACPDFFDSHES